jgi:tRNA(adenine34) deaminase
MREALAEAEAAAAAGERPIGAVVVVAGEIVSRGRSRQNELRSQLAHAELEALQNGGEAVWQYHEQAVLFSTVEPCPLCLGATVMADVPHVIYGVDDPFMQTYRLIEGSPYIARHIRTYCGGVLVEQARALIERYMAEHGRRSQPARLPSGIPRTGLVTRTGAVPRTRDRRSPGVLLQRDQGEGLAAAPIRHGDGGWARAT